MGFLHKLWDETLAGPAPESGLGKLRKCNSVSAVRSPNHPVAAASRSLQHRDRHQIDGHDHHLDYHNIQVSRSITILRTRSVDHGSDSSSPRTPTHSSGSSSPVTPGTPRDPDVKRFSRKKQTLGAMEDVEPADSAAYDWIMISALDR